MKIQSKNRTSKTILALAVLATLSLGDVPAAYKETLSTGAGSSLGPSAKEDLGDIHESNLEPFKPTFRSSFSANGSYTSNARMQGSHSSSDFIFQPTLEAGVNIPLGHGFDLDLVARIESATYLARGARNFFGASGGATLSYTYDTKLPRIFIGAEPYWYGQMDGDRISSAIGLTAGIDHSYVINRGRSVVFGGYQFYRYFAAPSRDERDAHQVILGLTHQFRTNLFGQIFYSVRYEDFDTRNYTDFRHAAGVSLLYQFSENVFGTITGTYVQEIASDDIHDYSAVGLTLGVTWQF